MRSSWSEPYLWVHLSGIAAVPIFLELCLVGLAASQTVLPAGIGFLLVALVGISPILWMQWYRPFSIFSLIALSLKSSELTEMQRQILRRFKTPVAKAVAVIVAILAFLILWQLNQWLPYAPMLKLPGGWLGGLVLAAVAFLLSNLFLQVPASVLMVLLTPESQIAAANPYPVAQIPADFTLIGLQVKQILPPIVLALSAPVASVAEAPSSKLPEPEIPQPEIQPEIIQPESAQPETQLETTQLETTQLEIVQPEIIQLESAQPETQLEATQLEATQLEATQLEATQLEATQLEATQLQSGEPDLSQPKIYQPESTEPPTLEAEAPNLAESAPHSELAQTELNPAAVEAKSSQQEPPTKTDAGINRQIPQVADTVVKIEPSSVEPPSPLPLVEAIFPSVDPSQNGFKAVVETVKAKPSALPPPSVTDTIVIIEPPQTEEQPPEE